MLKWLSDFYKTHKYVILWTVGYFVATWAIMKFMFDFNILSAHRWWQLAHAELHGFPGFVFGILILAAVPMYIATTLVVARTKAPLFTIKIPEFIKRAFQQTPIADAPAVTDRAPAPAPTPVDDTPVAAAGTAPIPDAVPNEIRIAYARARENVGRMPTSAFDLGNVTTTAQQQPTPAPEPQPVAGEIPIPSDFDIDDVDTELDSVPQFKDINFDDDDDDDDTDVESGLGGIRELSETVSTVAKYLDSKSVPYKIVDDTVVTDKSAIVAHTDSEFWVADETAWFAAGKTRPSPIELVKRVATEHNVEPVLYLGANNIMEIDTLMPQWTSSGIRIITNLDDLI